MTLYKFCIISIIIIIIIIIIIVIIIIIIVVAVVVIFIIIIIYAVAHPQDTTCNPVVVFLVFYQTEQMNQSDISCSLCSHDRECQSKSHLKKRRQQFN